MKKRIVSLFLVLAMALSMTMTVSFATGADTPVYPDQACTCTSHAEDDGNGWLPLYKTMTEDLAKRQEDASTDQYYILSDGKYYVEQDITVNARIYLFGNVTICLNGKTITGTVADTMGLFNLYAPSGTISGESFAYTGSNTKTTLTLCDHDPANAGTITSSSTNSYPSGIRTSTGSAIINLQAGNITGFRGAGINLAGSGTLNILGGTIFENGSALGSNADSKNTSCGVHMTNGTMNLKGGSITGNTAKSGAGVYMLNGKLNITGGTICNNNATSANAGAGVYMVKGTFTMSGGSITGNTVSYTDGLSYGIGVYIKGGTFNLNGGTISNHGAKEGLTGLDMRGTVYPAGSGATFNMTGGTITGNNVTYGGGAMIRNGSETNLSGGTITGNSAGNQGGAIFSYETATLNISGDAAIYGNTAGSATKGPNLFVYNTSSTDKSYLTITGGQIGSATDAYGIYFSKGSSQTTTPGAAISGNPVILGSTAGINGSIVPNLYLQGLTEGAFISTYKIEATTTDDTVSTTGNYSYRPAGYSSSQPGGYVYAAEVTAPGTYTLSDDMYLVGKATLETAGEYVIDLNGYDLSGSATPYFSVGDGVELTIKDSAAGTKGSVRGFANDPGYEGLVKITSGGQFDLYDVTMTGRSATQHNAGAVRINDGGVFNMHSGTISGNTVPNSGGGVLVNVGAEFNMYGGTITDNHSDGTGSGVWNNGTMTMSGGIISGNTTNHANGGQVFLQNSTLNVSGTAVIGAVKVNAESSTTLNIAELIDGAEIISTPAADSIDSTVKFETVTEGNRYTYQAEAPAHTCSAATLTLMDGKSATCTEDGYKGYYKCSCGLFFADAEAVNKIEDLAAWQTGDGKIAATGHTLTLMDGKSATCTEDGYKGYYMCECGKFFEDAEAVTEIENLAAWQTGDGKIAAGHTPTQVNSQPATATQDGYLAYYKCECGKFFEDEAGENEIPDLDAWKTGDGRIPATGPDAVEAPGGILSMVQTGMSITVTMDAPQDTSNISYFSLSLYDSTAPSESRMSGITCGKENNKFYITRTRFDPAYNYDKLEITAIAVEGYANAVWTGDVSVSRQDKAPVFSGFAYDPYNIPKPLLTISFAEQTPGFFCSTIYDGDQAIVNEDTCYSFTNDVGLALIRSCIEEEQAAITGGTAAIKLEGWNVTVLEQEGQVWKIGFVNYAGQKTAVEVCTHETREIIPAVAPTESQPGSTAGEKCSECGFVTAAPVEIPAVGEENIDQAMDVEVYKQNNIAPTKTDYVFAGWYADADRTQPFADSTGSAYARYVAKDVLSIKGQVTAGTTTESESADLRILSTVDCLNYRQVGFKITVGDQTIKVSTNTVYTSIVAKEGGVGFDKTPDVFHADSQYFITYTLTDIPKEDFETEIVITPYWITMDGTEYEGVTNTLKVSMGYTQSNS